MVMRGHRRQSRLPPRQARARASARRPGAGSSPRTRGGTSAGSSAAASTAASASAQIVRPSMLTKRLARRSRSAGGALALVDAVEIFSSQWQPSRHGVHWPHDSSREEVRDVDARLRPCRTCRPSRSRTRCRGPLPTLARSSKPIFTSSSASVRTGIERPPGITALILPARAAARRRSRRRARRTRDAGLELPAGRASSRGPRRPSASCRASRRLLGFAGSGGMPCFANAAPPCSTIHGTCASVSTLLIIVGQRERALDGGEGRLDARVAALALERLEHPRLLAADVGAGARVHPGLAREATSRGCSCRAGRPCAPPPIARLEARDRQRVLAAHVDVDHASRRPRRPRSGSPRARGAGRAPSASGP